MLPCCDVPGQPDVEEKEYPKKYFVNFVPGLQVGLS